MMGEDEGRIWNARIEEKIEKRPQKLGVVGEIFIAKTLEVLYVPGNKSGIHNGILLRKSMEKRNCPVL